MLVELHLQPFPGFFPGRCPHSGTRAAIWPEHRRCCMIMPAVAKMRISGLRATRLACCAVIGVSMGFELAIAHQPASLVPRLTSPARTCLSVSRGES